MAANTFSNDGLDVGSVSLNSLRAFESAARHLSFTRAAAELSVTQAAVSHQVKALEDRLGAALFRRTPRGLVLTDEGIALIPTLTDTFERLTRLLNRFNGGRVREVLTVSVVGTFAVGWLLPRLAAFRAAHPYIDLRLLTNNNKVDMAGESLDLAIRFGNGAWHGAESEKILDAPLAALCSPRVAQRLRSPEDLNGAQLLRSFRVEQWPAWFRAAGVEGPDARGPIFDSSWLMVQAAMMDEGVALVPYCMFESELASGRLVKPFDVEVDAGGYWCSRLVAREETEGMKTFRKWLASPSPA